MKTKTIILLLTAYVFYACGNSDTDQRLYTCVMHPEIIRDQPGQCPICGMNLVEKKEKPATDDSLYSLLLSPNRFIVSEAATTTPVQLTLPVELQAAGLIEYDQRDQQVITAWVDGWIEKLYVRYLYQPVKKGEKLMDIYSKEVVTEQANYLFLLEHDAENTRLIDAAEKKLKLLGMTSGQISELRKTKKTRRLVTIYSPYDGHLHGPGESGMTDQPMAGPMNGSNTQPEPTILREGSGIHKGQPLFNIYGTERVWAALRIPGNYQNQLRVGDPVDLQTTGGEMVNARIDFISPALNAQQLIEVRIYLDNRNGQFSIGTPVDARIALQPATGLFVPTGSVVFLGTRQVVFLKKDQGFQVRDVITGIQSGEFVRVISGIDESDTLALHAQMLVDSESFITP